MGNKTVTIAEGFETYPAIDQSATPIEVYSHKPWWLDTYDMHVKFDFHPTIDQMDDETLTKMLKFRLDFIQEELDEAKSAKGAEDVVDAMIDICVVAIGTLDAFRIDAQESWDRVHTANMAKERGIKPERPNPLGLPDLIKPEGWIAPNHKGNHGLLVRVNYEGFEDLFNK